MAATEQREGPHVLIAGGGMGGLFLGILLEKAGISYQIFERASKIKQLGSAMAFGPTILPAFEQLGLLEELKSISIDVKETTVRDEDLKVIATAGFFEEEEIGGTCNRMFARPQMYSLLLRQIPPEKIHLGKKILRVEEKSNRVIIHCSDGSSYDGDILVGADGTYSTVRQSMYKAMEGQGLLPKADTEDMIDGFSCIVGVTDPLDPEKYPAVKDERCHSDFILGSNLQSWCTWTVRDRICWSVKKQYVSQEEAKKEKVFGSEWRPESESNEEAMLKNFEDKPVAHGGTMGDLFKATPKDTISKVYLEHKMFETWFYNRSVLLGDACHKMLPSAGQGGINALQDAVILANCLYDLEDNSQQSITAAFQSYYNQRFEHAKTQYDYSKLAAQFINGQSWTEKILRSVLLNYMPRSVTQRHSIKSCQYRPIATFLEPVTFRGSGPVLPQLPSVRYAKEQAAKGKEKEKKDSEARGETVVV